MVEFSYKEDTVFVQVIEHVLTAEGGYVDDPNDPGGPTKFGIAQNYNADELKALGVQHVKNLTLEQAKEIYYHKYWLLSDAPSIPDVRLGYVHFDCAVNQGVGAASQILKKLSKRPRDFEGRGKNSVVFLLLILEYIARRLLRYTQTRGWDCKRCCKHPKYGAGWTNRVANLLLAVMQIEQ